MEPEKAQEIREWFQKARNDLRGAEIDLSALPPLLEDVMFHTARDLFDLEGCHPVAQDVAQVSGVPIEAFEFIHSTLSVYTQIVYTSNTKREKIQEHFQPLMS